MSCTFSLAEPGPHLIWTAIVPTNFQSHRASSCANPTTQRAIPGTHAGPFRVVLKALPDPHVTAHNRMTGAPSESSPNLAFKIRAS